jgi:ComEC/Rec2-related protein
MVLRALFFTCMFSALQRSWGMDLTVLLGVLLFPRFWRKASSDITLVSAVILLLFVLKSYSEWRYWHPLKLPEIIHFWTDYISALFAERISSIAGGAYGQFLKAVLLADKSGLSDEVLLRFRDLGISHVLAVSGFHIGFWVLLTRPLFLWARRPNSKLLAHFAQFALLFFYAQLVGASPSVLRAVWMFALARLAALRQWRIPSLHFPMLVAVGHYFINPKAPESLSFQLSYVAVFAILLALRKHKGEELILHYSYKRSRNNSSWFFVPIQISLAAWSATLPIVQSAFGGSSPYFLAGNLLVVPLITLMIWASVPLLALGDVLPQEVIDHYEIFWMWLMHFAQGLLVVLQEL